MKKISYAFLLTLAVYMCACKKDDHETVRKISIQEPAGGFKTDRYQVLRLSASGDIPGAAYEWSVDGVVMSTGDSLLFISDVQGKHDIMLSVRDNGSVLTNTVSVQVNKEAVAYSKGVTKVFEYFPAPGQFINELPAFNDGETAEQVRVRAENALKKDDMICLGGFGGFVVLGFDHAIMNVAGKNNFRVLGNAFGEFSEAGIIEVAIDANGNGLPDDEWYEIAGSDYNSPKTVREYEITYFKPDENKVPMPYEDGFMADTTYLKWTDNKGGSGYLSKNVFHGQTYYPRWKGNSITFRGTKLTADNIADQSGNGTYFVSPAFSFGYADNWSNDDDLSGIRLDWAVDKAGKPVKLPAVNFVRVHTALRAEAGWLGEISTEVSGVHDLNMQ